MKRLLIVGAGEAGRMIAREIAANKDFSDRYLIAGFIDDDPDKKSAENYPVLGNIQNISKVIEQFQIEEVIIAIPSAEKDEISRILRNLSGKTIRTKIVPGIYEIIQGTASFNQIRNIKPSDLLGREEVGFDTDKITPYYQDKTVFVTGAGGSIGSEIFIQLLNLPVKKVVAFGHGENSIHSLIQKVGKDKRFSYIIGDIRDYSKLRHELDKYKPDIMFHAAAHKHVPLMEDYPEEALKNNILGTYNVAKASIESSVKRFVLISTDKAVNPTSVMGATKRIAEKIILSFDQLQVGTLFSLTRFGNVLGSRGSVIPIFKEQIESGGPVTVTHADISRFFMSIREAARLVIKSATIHDGKIFVLDMGKPVKIIDLARNMIQLSGYTEDEIKIEITGLRPGEKMYEEVLTEDEQLIKSSFEKLFISRRTVKTFSRDELEHFVGEVIHHSEAYDQRSIRKLIKNTVPEFTGE